MWMSRDVFFLFPQQWERAIWNEYEANVIYYTNNNHFLAIFTSIQLVLCKYSNIRKWERENVRVKCNNANRYCLFSHTKDENALWIFLPLSLLLFCSCAQLIHVKIPEHVGLPMNPFTVHAVQDILASCVKVRQRKLDFPHVVF